MSEAKRKNNEETKVMRIPESKAAALKYFYPKILLTDWVIYVYEGLKCIPKTEQVVAKIKPINNWDWDKNYEKDKILNDSEI